VQIFGRRIAQSRSARNISGGGPKKKEDRISKGEYIKNASRKKEAKGRPEQKESGNMAQLDFKKKGLETRTLSRSPSLTARTCASMPKGGGVRGGGTCERKV